MKTTEQLRAGRKGPLELPAMAGSGGGWMGDANGDLVEDDFPGDRDIESNAELQDLRNALAADLQPLGDALFAASQAGDIAAVKAAARRISKDMPDFMESEALAELIGEQMMEAISEA